MQGVFPVGEVYQPLVPKKTTFMDILYQMGDYGRSIKKSRRVAPAKKEIASRTGRQPIDMYQGFPVPSAIVP